MFYCWDTHIAAHSCSQPFRQRSVQFGIAGTLFILSGRFTETTRRYYVIPLFLDLLAVFALGAIIVITGKGEIPGSVPDIVWTGWAAGTLLLAACFLAVFLAMPAAPRIRYVACAITAIICAPVAIALGLLIKDYPYGIFESAIGLMSLYWIALRRSLVRSGVKKELTGSAGSGGISQP